MSPGVDGGAVSGRILPAQLADALEHAQAAHATAESASAARRAMLTDIGRELRTPLTMVVDLLGRIILSAEGDFEVEADTQSDW